jgi:hypothetical protein
MAGLLYKMRPLTVVVSALTLYILAGANQHRPMTVVISISAQNPGQPIADIPEAVPWASPPVLNGARYWMRREMSGSVTSEFPQTLLRRRR